MLSTKPIKPMASNPRAEILEICNNSCFAGFLATFNTLAHLLINCLVLTKIDIKTRKLDVF
jgi:hypothetical protein